MELDFSRVQKVSSLLRFAIFEWKTNTNRRTFSGETLMFSVTFSLLRALNIRILARAYSLSVRSYNKKFSIFLSNFCNSLQLKDFIYI